VVRADSGGSMRWVEAMVVIAFVHVGGAPPMLVSD
jgi:hypothetical protein